MDIYLLLKIAVENEASDVFLMPKRYPLMKVSSNLYRITEDIVSEENTEIIAKKLLSGSKNNYDTDFKKEIDISIEIKNLCRARVNIFKYINGIGVSIRLIPFSIPSPESMRIPNIVMDMTNYSKGIVIVSGTAGSGKSTTLACMIDKINSTKDFHIITIEDPIEFKHTQKMSIVTQREVGEHTKSYKTAIKSAMRQSPNVILLGELRDYKTISAAITAAETGHIVFSTLHTIGAINTIERIVDVFPHNGQNQIRMQLAMSLNAVISQKLVKTSDGSMHPVFEILVATQAVKNIIREGKTHQLQNIISTNKAEGMIDMESSLLELHKKGIINFSQ